MNLQASADGNRLVYRRQESHKDVFILPLDDLSSPRRLTHEDWAETPSGWTAAGQPLYVSNRSGNGDLYVQDLETLAPTLLAGGPTYEGSAEVHGDSVLFWRDETDTDGVVTGHALMRVEGGTSEAAQILRVDVTPEQADPSFRCPQSPELDCVFAERVARFMRFSWLDPSSPELGEPFLAVPTGAGVLGWDLAPDARHLAVLLHAPSRIVIHDLEDGSVNEHLVDLHRARDVAWGPSGGYLYVSGYHLSNPPYRVLRMALDGSAETLWISGETLFSDPTPSPDGRFLALGVTSFEVDDLWLLERSK